MLSVIKPNRTEVSRSFPVLGFTIRTAGAPWFEIAVATDPALFDSSRKEDRTTATFWSSRGMGALPAERGEAVFLVPPDVLARFAGKSLLYFAAATFASPDRANPALSLPPAGAASSVSISGSFSGVSRRLTVLGPTRSRPSASGSYGDTSPDSLTWAGDDVLPGTISTVPPPAVGSNGNGTTTSTSANGASSNGAAVATESSGQTSPAPAPTNGTGAARPAPATTGTAQSFVYDDGYGPLVAASRPGTRTMDAVDIHVSPAVQLVPQLTGMSCWAAAAAMVVGWRDQISVNPSEVANRTGRWAEYRVGLSLDDVDEFGAALGLEAEPPVCYSVEGFARLLEWAGPLWVGTGINGGHVVVVTGLTGDGTPDGTTVIYQDPQPVDRGTAGVQASYTDFMRLFEAVASTDPSGNVNVLVLHAPARTSSTSNGTTTSQAVGDYWASQARAATRPLSEQSFDVFWPDVQLVPQPTDDTCWAGAAAMVAGWAGLQSIPPSPGPEGYSGVATRFGLTMQPPQNYPIDTLRQLLVDHGPIWVSAVVPPDGGYHAVVITGLYGDGDATNTYVRINDPWDRDPGTPGSPGAYLNTHDHGSTYILRFDEFLREYEAVPRDPTLDPLQVMYASAGPGGRTPSAGAGVLNVTQGLSMANGGPSTYRRASAARPFSGEPFDVFWPDVQLINQQSDDSCSAASAAMVAGWGGLQSIPPGDRHEGHEVVAARFGLAIAPPQNYTIEGLRDMLVQHGPLWVAAVIEPTLTYHAVVITGMSSGGNPDGSDTILRINDPWDWAPGTTGHPGPPLPTHDHGSTYTLTFAEYLRDYERVPQNPGYDQTQILYWPDGPVGRTPATGASALGVLPRGALAQQAAVPAVIPIASAIIGASMTRILNNEGDIHWELDQLNGLKYPGNDPSQVSGTTFSTTTIDVPSLKTATMLGFDEIFADIEITYQWDGRTLGNIQVAVVRPNDAVGAGLQVKEQIMDEANVFTSTLATGTHAAVKVRIQYTFDGVVNPSNYVGFCDLVLYGDGNWTRSYRWTQ